MYLSNHQTIMVQDDKGLLFSVPLITADVVRQTLRSWIRNDAYRLRLEDAMIRKYFPLSVGSNHVQFFSPNSVNDRPIHVITDDDVDDDEIRIRGTEIARRDTLPPDTGAVVGEETKKRKLVIVTDPPAPRRVNTLSELQESVRRRAEVESARMIEVMSKVVEKQPVIEIEEDAESITEVEEVVKREGQPVVMRPAPPDTSSIITTQADIRPLRNSENIEKIVDSEFTFKAAVHKSTVDIAVGTLRSLRTYHWKAITIDLIGDYGQGKVHFQTKCDNYQRTEWQPYLVQDLPRVPEERLHVVLTNKAPSPKEMNFDSYHIRQLRAVFELREGMIGTTVKVRIKFEANLIGWMLSHNKDVETRGYVRKRAHKKRQKKVITGQGIT